MNGLEYVSEKTKYAYSLFKQIKFFKKARAIVVKDNELLVIKVLYNNGDTHYLLPGGGVDEGESVKQATIRETLEEYNVNVVPVKYLGKQYYSVNMEINDEKFKSNRVEYFYVCKYISSATDTPFGIEGEFEKSDRNYIKTTLTLEELKKINHKDLNGINQQNINKLIKFMEESQ